MRDHAPRDNARLVPAYAQPPSHNVCLVPCPECRELTDYCDGHTTCLACNELIYFDADAGADCVICRFRNRQSRHQCHLWLVNPPRWPDLPTEPMKPHRWQDDPNAIEALKERDDWDVWLVECPMCGSQTYYNQGSHATCTFCKANCDEAIEEAYTVEEAIEADVWEEPLP